MSNRPALPSEVSMDSQLTPRPEIGSMDPYLASRYAARFGWYSVLILLTVVSIFPLVWMVSTSFRQRFDALGGPLIPTSLTLDAYRFVFGDFHILNYFGNSLLVCGVSALVVVSLSTLAG